MGAGQSFNLDEKEFVDSLYTVILCLYQQPFDHSTSDFLAFLKCVHLVFVQKKQFQNEVINAFVKRLAIL